MCERIRLDLICLSPNRIVWDVLVIYDAVNLHCDSMCGGPIKLSVPPQAKVPQGPERMARGG